MVLLVSFTTKAKFARTELHEPSAEQLSRPAELRIRAVSEAEHGIREVFEEVFRQVGAEKHLP